jgi:hypothetical protein
MMKASSKLCTIDNLLLHTGAPSSTLVVAVTGL